MIKVFQVVTLALAVLLVLGGIREKSRDNKIIYLATGSFLGVVALASTLIMEVLT